MIRPYLNKPSLVILLTILSFNLKAQSYISDGVYIGGGSQFYNWTFDEVHYKTDNGKGLSLNVGKSLSSEIGLYIGIDDAAIYNENSDVNYDTFCEKNYFFSYRRSRILKHGDYGRCISVIRIL